MMSYEQRMIDAQAQVISELRRHIDSLNHLKGENDRLRRAANFYNAIVAAIKDDEMLQDAWGSFIATLKLRSEQPIPGLTGPER